jgi:hypothetical protein
MSTEAQYNKALEIVKGLPPTGKVQPTNDDKLAVCHQDPLRIPLKSCSLYGSRFCGQSKVLKCQI